MKSYPTDLDFPIMQINCDNGCANWRLYNCFESVIITGGVGSGKSTSSSAFIASKYLANNFGGLVLTAKADEADTWREYCKKSGRLDDFILLEPGGEHSFDFLMYLSTHPNEGTRSISNIVKTLKLVLQANEEKSSGSSNADPFWAKSLEHVLQFLLQLNMMAYGVINVMTLYEILISLPKNEPVKEQAGQKKIYTAFEIAFLKAKKIMLADIESWNDKQSLDRLAELKFLNRMDATIIDEIPSVRTFKYLDLFFFETFKNLAQKTRSIVEFNLSEFLFNLLQEPFYSLFCKGITFRPEDCLDGKIIVLNIPVKLYHEIGRDCQTLFKKLFQIAMEKRDLKINQRPVFVFADEFQNFVVESDTDFQTTARGSRISSIYITQNLSNLYSAMGGQKSEHKVKSLIGVFGTKIMHANTSAETNNWGSELIGDAIFLDPSRSVTTAENFSQSDSLSLKLDRQVRPEEFVGLKTGGRRNNFKVEAYIHVQGDKIFDNQNFKKVKFTQIFI